jgi:hypothetical protein
MELLILCALACWGGGRYLVHAPLRIAERRQRASQAHQLRMARLAKRQGPTISQAISARIARRIANPKGGPAREAIALWWSDSWGYATDRRLRRHERAEAGQLGRQRAARAATRWLGAQWADLTGPDPGQRESVQADATVTHPTADPEDIVDAEIVEDDPGQDPTGPAATPDTPTAPAEADTGPQTEQNEHDDNQTDDHQTDDHQTDDHQHEQNEHEQDGQSDDEADAQLASVHPLHRKEFTMSAPTTTIASGETLDPAAARRFSADIEEAARQLHDQVELSVTSLTGCGVAGEPIDDLTAIQEALSVVMDRARASCEHFDRHLGVQDHVMSDPSLADTVHDTYLARG